MLIEMAFFSNSSSLVSLKNRNHSGKVYEIADESYQIML